MRRAGFLATLATGFSLLGVSLHGMTSVDRTLKIAASPTPAPMTFPVLEHPHGGRDCHRHHDHRPEV